MESWLKYLDAIYMNLEQKKGGRVADLGIFTLVRHHQLQVYNLDGNNIHSETPKFSPIATRTRSKTAKHGRPGLFDTPSRPPRKQTSEALQIDSLSQELDNL